MIDIRIPKEVRQYEAKFVGPLTKRQTICAAIGLPICVGIYNVLKPYVSVDIIGFFLLVPAAIILLFGWVKPYGMKFEQFFFSALRDNFIAPQKRVYVTVNQHKSAILALRDDGKEKVQGKKKKYIKSNLAVR